MVYGPFVRNMWQMCNLVYIGPLLSNICAYIFGTILFLLVFMGHMHVMRHRLMSILQYMGPNAYNMHICERYIGPNAYDILYLTESNTWSVVQFGRNIIVSTIDMREYNFSTPRCLDSILRRFAFC